MPQISVVMRERYQGWRGSLPAGDWQGFFPVEIQPNFEAAGGDRNVEGNVRIWPSLQQGHYDNAPAGAHICRAFRGILPDDVRFVILGRDPYDKIEQATGRAFECHIAEGGLPPSIIAPMLWAMETQPAPGRFTAFSPGEARSDAVSRWFNYMAGIGAIWLNWAWTYSCDQDQNYHSLVWRPVMSHLIQTLVATRPNVRFLTLGDHARELAAAVPHDRKVHRIHPSDPQRRHYAQPNPFVELSGQLQWWPPAEAEGGQ